MKIMILHLDSNFRNRQLYPNPTDFTIEINGTPPNTLLVPNNRCFNISSLFASFSFTYFSKSKPLNYYCTGEDSIYCYLVDILNALVPDSNDVNIKYVYNTYIFQNFLIGYYVQDIVTGNSAIINASNLSGSNIITILLENKIADDGYEGTLEIFNPVFGIPNLLLVSGYSIFNQANGQLFYNTEGIQMSSIIVNLTQKWISTVENIIEPYRIVKYSGDYQVHLHDNICVLTNPINNRFNHRKIYIQNLKQIFQNSIFTFKMEIPMEFYHDLQETDLFLSEFGEDPRLHPSFTFYLDQNDISIPKTKIIVKIKKEEKSDTLVPILIYPGSGINSLTNYMMYCERLPHIKIVLQSQKILTSILSNELPISLDRRYFILFIESLVNFPFYFEIQKYEKETSLVYLENLDENKLGEYYLFLPESVILIDRYCFLPYEEIFPNLVMPVSNFQQKCYTVQLHSITLPNLPICGSRFLLADFPYVLVTFGNITNSESNSTMNIGVMTTNNPNAIHATFVCPIANIRNPDTIKYVVVRSSQKSQQVKLNFAENIKFRVYLPDNRPLIFSNRFLIDYQTSIVSSSNFCFYQNFLVSNPSYSIFPSYDDISVSATFSISEP